MSASVFGLTDPLRLVIDLPELDWQVPQSQGGNGVGMVESFRSGLFRPGNTRVVLVLARPVDVAAEFLLPPSDDFGWRWVVDLVPADAKAFAALVQPPTAGKARPKRKPLDLLAQAAGDSRPMVVIDPGHGGNDPGAVGVGGSVEKDLVLAYAEELKLILLDSGRYRVALTRDDDTYLPLRGRTGVARSQDAALFISLHVNTDPSEHTRGFFGLYSVGKIVRCRGGRAGGQGEQIRYHRRRRFGPVFKRGGEHSDRFRAGQNQPIIRHVRP